MRKQNKLFYGYKISRGYKRLTLFIYDAKTHQRISVQTRTWLPCFTRDDRKKLTDEALKQIGISSNGRDEPRGANTKNL